jgi:hypothetical protein
MLSEILFRFVQSRCRSGRFAARVPGLASGLALAVRPAGLAEAPRARVGPEDAFCGAVFAERSERIFGCPCGWRGQPGQCAAFWSTRCDILPATGALGATLTAQAVVLAGAAAGYGGDRRRPVTGGAVRGPPPRRRTCVRRTRRSGPSRNGPTPG